MLQPSPTRFFRNTVRKEDPGLKGSSINSCVILDNVDEMVVTWNTLEETSDSFVEYGETGTDQKISGKAKVFNDSVYQFVHRVTIINLKPTTKYGNVHTLKSNMSRESFVNQFFTGCVCFDFLVFDM